MFESYAVYAESQNSSAVEISFNSKQLHVGMLDISLGQQISETTQ